MQLTAKQKGSTDLAVVLIVLVLVVGSLGAAYYNSLRLSNCEDNVEAKEAQIASLKSEALRLTQTIEDQNNRVRELLEASQARSEEAQKSIKKLRAETAVARAEYDDMRKKWAKARAQVPKGKQGLQVPVAVDTAPPDHVAVVCSQVGDMLRQYHEFRQP